MRKFVDYLIMTPLKVMNLRYLILIRVYKDMTFKDDVYVMKLPKNLRRCFHF